MESAEKQGATAEGDDRSDGFEVGVRVDSMWLTGDTERCEHGVA